MSFIRKHHLKIFFAVWFLLNLIQAGYTELFDDEAYYWVYSKFLDWGYFDHPPMIAVLINAGYQLLKNELGVRLLVLLLNTLTLVVIYRLLPVKNDRLFYAIACSIAVLQIGGVIAVPDIPLTFFAALFFLMYKKFVSEMTLWNTVLLGVVMALVLYSKYHGILIIFFTFMSNLKLATRYQAYLSVLIGAVLFLPHLYWQYNHGFPSLQYHLFERNAATYKFSYTIEYIFGQILMAGPLMGWLLMWAAFRYNPIDLFERALKFCLIGFYVFFLFSSVRGRVEANWTVPCLIPLIILSHQYLLDKVRLNRFLMKSVPVTLLLVLVARTYMMIDLWPAKGTRRDEFHLNRQWAESIYKKTGVPVVFVNSYQDASKYWFYTGVTSFSLNTPAYRRNNFNFWPVENELYNRKVAAISHKNYSYYTDSIFTPIGLTGSVIVDSFFSFATVKIAAAKKWEVKNGNIQNCVLHFDIDKLYLKAFQSKNLYSRSIDLVVFDENIQIGRFSTNILLSSIQHSNQIVTASFPVNLPPGVYSAKLALPTSLDIFSLNSRTLELRVIE